MALVSTEVFPLDLLPGDVIRSDSGGMTVVSIGSVEGEENGPEIPVECRESTLSLPIETPVSIQRNE